MPGTSDIAGFGRLDVSETPADGALIITARGEIDHDTRGPLRQALEKACERTTPRIVVDLGGVSFMDSSGINILLTACARVRDADGWLRVAGATGSVLRTLRLLGLTGTLGDYVTADEALAD